MDKAVKALWVTANFFLLLAYICAWYQIELSVLFNKKSAVALHLAIAGPSMLLHFFASLGVLFYFIGTGTWMKDQAHSVRGRSHDKAQKIWDIYERCNRLKGWAFPFPTFCIFLGILTFVIGAAIDIGAVPHWVHPTLATALTTLGILGSPFIFWAMKRNVEGLDQISNMLDQSHNG